VLRNRYDTVFSLSTQYKIQRFAPQKKTTMYKLHLLALVAIFSFTSLKAQTFDAKFGKGFSFIAKDSSFSMNIGMRVQTLYTNEWTVRQDDLNNIGDNSSNFLVRRARLKFDGFAYTPKLEYKIELGLSNRDLAVVSPETRNTPGLILDAVLKYNVAKNLWFWFGQTKLPGNRERIISSANLQFVDRSALNSQFNADRDLGIQLHYKIKAGNQVFKPIVSVSQGEGRNITQGNLGGGYQYIGKLEWLPLGDFTSKGDYSGSDLKREATPKLAITGAYAYNNKTSRNRDQLGSFIQNNDGSYATFNTERLFSDITFKYKGFSFMSEYASRRSDYTLIYDRKDTTDQIGKVYTGQAFNIQMGYLMKKNCELAVRYTKIMPDNVIGKQEDAYTLGFSKYIVGHKLKFQTDITYTQIKDKDDELMYRMQFELHF
jgi:phosphate-selective porin OprO/OprP